jgi:hypothetical protein
MILRNLTKEKASEIIEKGKVLGSQEMGTSEFKLLVHIIILPLAAKG